MYLWRLLPSSTSGPSLGHGTCLELAAAMRLTEPALTSRLVFMIAITELVPRIMVDDLVPGYVPTGREWHARRTRDDKARWITRQVPVNPGEIYYLEMDEFPDAAAIPEEVRGEGEVPDEDPEIDAPR